MIVPLLAATLIGLASLALYDGERGYSLRFLLTALALLLLDGALLLRLRRPAAPNVTEAFVSISLYWIALPWLSGMMLWLSAGLSPLDAMFESLSALSGAGFSFIEPEGAPRVVVLWRSVLQWLGGISIVVFGGAILPAVHGIIRSIYAIEVGVKLSATLLSTVRTIFGLYVGLSVLSIALLFLSGMSLFDAVNNGLTAVATGGMSTRDEGFSYWYNRGEHLPIIATMIIMIIGATNFADTFMLIRGNVRGFVRSPEVRGMAALLGIAVLLSLLHGSENFLPRLFNAISAITTTGFQIGEIESETEKIVLTILMIVGGATFSTAAGVKIKRVIIALKAAQMELSRPMVPASASMRMRVGEREVSEKEIFATVTYVLIYIIILVLSSLIVKVALSAAGIHRSYLDVLFETTSALSCVGLSVGVISPELPPAIKVLYMIVIYVGRIELLPLYLVVGLHRRAKVTL